MSQSKNPDERVKEIEEVGLEPLMMVESPPDKFMAIAGLGIWYPLDQLRDDRLWRTSPRASIFVAKRYCRFAFENRHDQCLWFAFGDVPLKVACEIFGGEGKTKGNGITLPYPDNMKELHLRPYVGPHDDHAACYCQFEIDGQDALAHFVRTLKQYDLHQVKHLHQQPNPNPIFL